MGIKIVAFFRNFMIRITVCVYDLPIIPPSLTNTVLINEMQMIVFLIYVF